MKKEHYMLWKHVPQRGTILLWSWKFGKRVHIRCLQEPSWNWFSIVGSITDEAAD